MQVSKDELLHALDVIKPGINNSDDLIQQSTNFAFLGDYVVSFNDQISIKFPFESEVKGVVSANELYQFLMKLRNKKKSTISLEAKGGQLIITAGKKLTVGLRFDSEIILPIDEVEQGTKWKKVPDNLLDALVFCSYSAGKDASKPILQCVSVGDNSVQASDGYRASRFKLNGTINKQFLLPATVIKDLKKFNMTHYNVTKSWVNFKDKEGAVFSCRIIRKDFPEISALLKLKGKKITFPQNIIPAIETAIIFSEKSAQVDSYMVKVILDDNVTTVIGEADGKFSREKLKSKYNGERVTFRIPSSFFIDMLKLDDTKCRLDKNSNRIKFSSGNWEHVMLLVVEDDIPPF